MKKNLLSVLILVLLVVNIALSVVMMVSVTGTNKKTADFITSVASVLNLELYKPGGVAVTDVSLDDTDVYTMPGLMIAVNTEAGKQGYVIFDLGLQQNKKHKDYKKYGGEDKMAQRQTMISDSVTSVVSSHTLEEFQKNMEDVRDEILASVQKLYSSDFIYRISISGVKYGN